MEQETEQKRECPGCKGEGVIHFVQDPQNTSSTCPVCGGLKVIAASRKIYLIHNPKLLDVEGFLAMFAKRSKRAFPRYPEDYVAHRAVEAESLRMACQCAEMHGTAFLPFTVVEQPDGTLFGYQVGHELLEH
jgi:hypothetical protein